MLANQLEYEEEYEAKLHRMYVFLCLFCIPAWLKCSVSADAPTNDLSFIKYMQKYCQIDHENAESACDKLIKHRWCLCKESIIFALFSDCLTITEKKAISEKILFHTPTSFVVGFSSSEETFRRPPSFLILLVQTRGFFLIVWKLIITG